MSEKKDILAKAIEAVKESSIAAGPPEELVEATVNRLAEIKPEPHKIKIKERIRTMNKLTKIAVAAVIVIAVLLSMIFFEKTTSTAYAIEQTIEAFQNVRFLHLMRHDETGRLEDERWIEIGDHGRQVRYRQDSPSRDFLVVEDGDTTAVFYKDKQTVVLYSNKDKQFQWVGNLGQVLENLRQEGQIIEENIDYNGQLVHKILWPALNAECYIDAVTKLPITMGANTEFSYEQPPDYIFEIELPQNFTVIDKRPGAELVEEPEWLNGLENADSLFHQARYALVSGDNQKASELFEYVVGQQPGRNWAWYWLGKAYYELGQYELAAEKFSKVIEMFGDTSCAYAYLARGLAYSQLDMQEESEDDLEIALPWMILTLNEPSTGYLFEYADDPTLREGKAKPSERQLIERMIVRLRSLAGLHFGYNFNVTPQENAEAIAAWQDWFENR